MRYIFTFIIIIQTCIIQAKSIGTSTLELLNNSQYIVEYKIIKVLEYHFQIKVTRVFKGNPSDTLTINKFMDWACGQRFGKYMIGQIGILFIETNSNSNKLEVMGSTNEGEFIRNNGIYSKDVDTIAKNSDFLNSEFTYDDLTQGISEYLEKKEYFEQLAIKNKLKLYKTKNKFTLNVLENLESNSKNLIKR